MSRSMHAVDAVDAARETHPGARYPQRLLSEGAVFVLPGDALGSLVETLPWPALVVDECGFIVQANAALREFRAIDGALAGAKLGERFSEYEAALSGDPWWNKPQEAQASRVSDGRVVHERLVVRPMTGGACLFIEDVTRLRELETVDAQTARLASLGFMLAGACHEISNPLTAVYSMVQLLGNNPQAAAPDVQRGLAHIGHNVHRLLEVCQRLCGYSRATAEPAATFAIDEAIEESILLLRQSGQLDRIELACEPEPRAVVAGHVGEMREVFQNLLINAVQAMDGAGRLHVRTRIRDGGRVHVAVQDSGPGIPEPVLARLFEPFFTTKRNGKGTGLGLALSREIVQQHGGRILARSAAEGGACFEVELPLRAAR